MKRSFALILLALGTCAGLNAQTQTAAANTAPPKSMAASLGLHAFPTNQQTPEQQRNDQAACYEWAKQDTSFDPLAASQQQQNPQSAPKGVALKSGAQGAGMGAAIGAISGDAVRGAAAGGIGGVIRGKMAQKSAEQKAAAQQQAKAQAQQSGNEKFKRAFSACMEGKGYSVK
jgi:hypothetical protein